MSNEDLIKLIEQEVQYQIYLKLITFQGYTLPKDKESLPKEVKQGIVGTLR